MDPAHNHCQLIEQTEAQNSALAAARFHLGKVADRWRHCLLRLV